MLHPHSGSPYEFTISGGEEYQGLDVSLPPAETFDVRAHVLAERVADPFRPRVVLAHAEFPSVQILEHREHADIVMARTGSYCLDATLMVKGVPASMSFRLVEEQIHRVQSFGTGYVPETHRLASGADGWIRVCDLADGVYRLVAGVPRPLAPGAPGYGWATASAHVRIRQRR